MAFVQPKLTLNWYARFSEPISEDNRKLLDELQVSIACPQPPCSVDTFEKLADFAQFCVWPIVVDRRTKRHSLEEGAIDVLRRPLRTEQNPGDFNPVVHRGLTEHQVIDLVRQNASVWKDLAL